MRLFPICLFTISLASCTFGDKQPQADPVHPNPYAPAYSQIDTARALFQEGDLVVRTGNDLTSQLIRNFNKHNKDYSHSGIVFFQNDTPFVYHLMSGKENPTGKMIAESIESFCHPRKNLGFAVYRYNMNDAEKTEMKKLVTNWYGQGLRFDSLFNLKTDDLMYCSEMIKKGLEKATNKRIGIKTVRPSAAEVALVLTQLPVTADYARQQDVIPIDYLFENPHCQLVRRFEFNFKK